jgi:hemerythrin-like domain-containing protein
LVDDRLILGETPVGRYVQEGMPNQHQMPEAWQIKAEHDQQPNLIQQLEISLQGLNMNFNQLAEHENSEYLSLLEPMLDHLMEEENELLNSVRAQLSKLEREMETQLQDDRQYIFDEQMVIRQMMSEIQRHS